MPVWIEGHRELLDAAMVAALVVSVLGVVLVPLLVALIPRDYFAQQAPPPLPWSDAHPMLRAFLTVLKNTGGGLLVLAGIAMLALPGQGILTLLVGTMLLDFPGKRAIELALVRKRGIRRVLDWIRARAGREPLRVG